MFIKHVLQMRGEIMNIKILETKLQTLLEDDDFIIDEENIIERLGKELASLIKEVAEYNEGKLDKIAIFFMNLKNDIQ